MSPVPSGISLSLTNSYLGQDSRMRTSVGSSIGMNLYSDGRGSSFGNQLGNFNVPLGSSLPPGMSSQSFYTLKSISQHRRVVSESSREEPNMRNSLKGFVSSSYDPPSSL